METKRYYCIHQRQDDSTDDLQRLGRARSSQSITTRNAEADESTVIYADRKRTAKNPAMELMITVMLHKMDDAEWTEEELSPLRAIKIMDVTPASSPLGAEITLSDGTFFKVYFEEIDGKQDVLKLCGQ